MTQPGLGTRVSLDVIISSRLAQLGGFAGDAWERAVLGELMRQASTVAPQYRAALQAEYDAKVGGRGVATGRTRDSLGAYARQKYFELGTGQEVISYGFVNDPPAWVPTLEHGRQPGYRPSTNAILQWMAAVGKDPAIKGDSRVGAAIRIAKHIERTGVKALNLIADFSNGGGSATLRRAISEGAGSNALRAVMTGEGATLAYGGANIGPQVGGWAAGVIKGNAVLGRVEAIKSGNQQGGLRVREVGTGRFAGRVR